MKNDMKLIMESWRNLQEQEVEQLDNIKTVGKAKKFIKMYRLQKAGKGAMKTATGVAVDSLVDELAGKIPGLKTAINIFKRVRLAYESLPNFLNTSFSTLLLNSRASISKL